MKRIVSTILVCVLMVCMLFTLASCGKKLNGAYSKEEDGVKLTYEFETDGTFKGTMDTFLGDVEFDGEYEIDGKEITIKYELLGKEVDETYDFKKGNGYIEIDGKRFDKE